MGEALVGLNRYSPDGRGEGPYRPVHSPPDGDLTSDFWLLVSGFSARRLADTVCHGRSGPGYASSDGPPDTRLPCDARGGASLWDQHRTTTAGRSPAIRS